MSLCSCYLYHSGTLASMVVKVRGAKANSRDASAKAGMSKHNRQSRAGQHSAVSAAKQNGAEQSRAEQHSAVNAAKQNGAEVEPALRRGWIGKQGSAAGIFSRTSRKAHLALSQTWCDP